MSSLHVFSSIGDLLNHKSDNLLIGSTIGSGCYIKTPELSSNRYVDICDYNSDVRPFHHNFTVISAWENVIGSDGLNIDR